jgi:hypothetical protein
VATAVDSLSNFTSWPLMPARSSAVGVDEYVLFEVVRLNETEALLVVVGQYSAFTEMFFH